MIKRAWIISILVIILSIVLSGCEKTVDEVTDPCAADAVAEAMKPITWQMHKFDDTTGVAGITPQQSLVVPVLELQKIRRDLEELEVPECLLTLQQAGINYMNSAITYLGMFMASVAQENVQSAITSSQNLRLVYESERARLLGKELVISPTNTPGPTQTMGLPTETTAASSPVVMVMNGSAEPINLRSKPAVDQGDIMETLPAGASATAIGKNAAGDWYFINYNGQYLWVLSSLVSVTGDANILPVIP